MTHVFSFKIIYTSFKFEFEFNYNIQTFNSLLEQVKRYILDSEYLNFIHDMDNIELILLSDNEIIPNEFIIETTSFQNINPNELFFYIRPIYLFNNDKYILKYNYNNNNKYLIKQDDLNKLRSREINLNELIKYDFSYITQFISSNNSFVEIIEESDNNDNDNDNLCFICYDIHDLRCFYNCIHLSCINCNQNCIDNNIINCGICRSY